MILSSFDRPFLPLTMDAFVNEFEFRPICRTVSDAVHVLDSIVGFDPRDVEATEAAAKFIPKGGYAQFLKEDGLRGKRLGVVRHPFVKLANVSSRSSTFEFHLRTLR